ncbi:MAG: DUF4124 domain-containing protein [Desulfobacterales bacterium]|nr:DUF4124 domain-containing protein [Desulfobacterales bacterium]
MKKLFLMFVILSFCSPFAYATVYKYVDDNGVTVYTDDFSQVPNKNRKIAEEFDEIKTTSDSEKTFNKDQEKPKKEIDYNKLNFNKFKEALVKKREALDNEILILNREKEELLKLEKTVRTKQGKIKYKQRATELNEKVEAFNQRQRDFSKQLEEYNNRFTKE